MSCITAANREEWEIPESSLRVGLSQAVPEIISKVAEEKSAKQILLYFKLSTGFYVEYGNKQ